MNNCITLSADPLIDIAINSLLSAHSCCAVQKNYRFARELLTDARTKRVDLFVITTLFDDMGIFDFTKRLRATHRQAKIAVLSHINYRSFVKRIIDLGINGYLPISSTEVEFNTMLSGIFKSNYFAVQPSEPFEEDQEDIFKGLGYREMDILIFLLRGYPIKSISQLLNLSRKTISTYKSNIYKKLEITNIIDLYLSLARKKSSNCS